jgi:hypothetical protein
VTKKPSVPREKVRQKNRKKGAVCHPSHGQKRKAAKQKQLVKKNRKQKDKQ